MGEFIIKTLEQAPFHALAVVAIVLAGYLALYFKQRLVKDFEGFGQRLDLWTRSMGQHMRETRYALNEHQESMGKASKAINGDMLRIRESVFELKQDINTQIESLKVWAGELERGVEKNAHQVGMAIEAFDEKIAFVVRLQNQIADIHGKIILIEKDAATQRWTVEKHNEHFERVAKLLKHHKAEIDRLKSGGRNGV